MEMLNFIELICCSVFMTSMCVSCFIEVKSEKLGNFLLNFYGIGAMLLGLFLAYKMFG